MAVTGAAGASTGFAELPAAAAACAAGGGVFVGTVVGRGTRRAALADDAATLGESAVSTASGVALAVVGSTLGAEIATALAAGAADSAGVAVA